MENFNDVPLDHLNEVGRWDRLFQRLSLVPEIVQSLQRLEEKMADVETVLQGFRAAVDKELLDDKAQNDLIALLQSRVADADALVQAARDGEAAAKTQVDELLVELELQTERLSENDLPDAPADVDPEDAPAGPGEPAPVEPTEPEPVEGGEVEPTLPEDGSVEPAPVEPVPGEGDVIEPDAAETGTVEPANPSPIEPDGEPVEGVGSPDEANLAVQPETGTDGDDEGPTPTPSNPFAV